MRPLRTFSVVAQIPENISGLWELARNFLFAWNDQIVDLFAQIDQRLWRETDGNPIAFLNRLPQATIAALSRDQFFLDRLEHLLGELRHYASKEKCSISFPYQKGDTPAVVRDRLLAEGLGVELARLLILRRLGVSSLGSEADQQGDAAEPAEEGDGRPAGP